MNDLLTMIFNYDFRMYGFKSSDSINECRNIMFMRCTANEKGNTILDCASNIDATLFPPSQIELKYQYQRAKYVSNLWLNSHKKQPTLLTPDGNGWTLQDDNYCFQWFSGEMVPRDVAEISLTSEVDNLSAAEGTIFINNFPLTCMYTNI